MSMLGKLAKGMKDSALGLALKMYLNERLSEYGEVLECTVETGASRVSVRALLKGEKEPLNVAVEHYELEHEGDQLFATLRGFSSSRPWIALLLGKLLTGKRYKLPSAVHGLLN